MGFIKKNLTFTVIVAVCVLAFAAGAYLAFAESGKIGKAKQKIATAETQLNGILFADPAPTVENVEASEGNVSQLSGELAKIREELQRGARLTASTDGIGVMAAIQQYISEFQRKASSNLDEIGEADPIEVPRDFAFGFDLYLDESTMLDDPEKIPVLDKQRQILEYLLNKLIAAQPHGIQEVERELLEFPEKDGFPKGFEISEANSASVPGAIDTLAFSVTFTGYTNSLRQFLNELAKFDLPIVVRSIKVERPSGQATTATPRNNVDDLFSAFGGTSDDEEEVEETKKLVISENTSSFTVVLEFIEIVLPADS